MAMPDDEPVPRYRSAGESDPDLLPGSLSLPATSEQVAQFVALRAAACVGAEYSNLALLSAATGSLRLFHGTFLKPEIADRYTDVSLDAPYPISAAVRSGRVVLLPDLESYQATFPEILPDTMAAGVQATASLPLYRSDGTVIGAIGFAWTEPTVFDRKLEAALRAVSQLCVETVERAEQYDAEHELIIEMQARLLGSLPVLAGIETYAEYLPASRAPSVGGDWYEGLILGPSKIAFVVGDVTGHGIVAAADMALIRGMISALLHAGLPASDVFKEVSGVLVQQSGHVLATAAVAIVDIAAETVTFATAGHPPPLIRLPDGQVRTLDTANCAMIGVRTTRSVEDTAPFPPGSKLVMYTDGLVERRDRPFDEGVAQVAALLAALPERLDPHHLADSLMDELIGDPAADDDIAILVVEHAL
jgi:serine phosphatase RsbU (regulator of sigma subunit)